MGGGNGFEDPLAAPVGLVATGGDGYVDLQWDWMFQVDGFSIYAGPDAEEFTHYDDAASNVVRLSGLPNGVPVFFAVTSHRGTEESPPKHRGERHAPSSFADGDRHLSGQRQPGRAAGPAGRD